MVAQAASLFAGAPMDLLEGKSSAAPGNTSYPGPCIKALICPLALETAAFVKEEDG